MLNTKYQLNQTILNEIVSRLDNQGLQPHVLSQLRLDFPGIHFTSCMQDDISENAKPIVCGTLYHLYLVNSSQHCSILSNDIDAASGVVIAELYLD